MEIYSRLPSRRVGTFSDAHRQCPVGACWQSLWTGGLLRWGVVPAGPVPTEGTGESSAGQGISHLAAS